MRKALIIAFLLLIATVATAIFYFSNIGSDPRQNSKVLLYIPDDASLILSLKNDQLFYDIFKDYKPFNALTAAEINDELKQLEAVFLNNPSLREAIAGQSIFLSLHANTSAVDFLWLITIKKQLYKDFYTSVLKSSSHYNSKTIEYNNDAYYKLSLTSINKPFYIFLSGEACIGSFSETLIKRAIIKDYKKIDKKFIEEIDAVNRRNANSPLNIFINHSTLPAFLVSFFTVKPVGNFPLLSSVKGFSTLNMNFKSDAIMFNGLSTIYSSPESYISIFLKQKPLTNTIKKIFPLYTANSLSFAISDYKLFKKDLHLLLKKRGESDRLKNQIENIKSQTGINLDRDFTNLFAKEFSVITLSNQEKIAIIKLTNGIKMDFLLEPVSSVFSGSIKRFNNSNILYYYFGDPFKPFSRPLYTVIDNYLVISNSLAAINYFFKDYNGNNFLNNTPSFQKFDQFLANQSNIWYFIHSDNSKILIKKTLKRGFTSDYDSEEYGLRQFYGLSWQWSAEGDHFFTNFYTQYKVASLEEASVDSIAKNPNTTHRNSVIIKGKLVDLFFKKESFDTISGIKQNVYFYSGNIPTNESGTFPEIPKTNF